MKRTTLFIALGASLLALPGFRQEKVADSKVSADELRKILKDANVKFEEEADEEKKTIFIIEKDDVTTLLFQYGGEGDSATSLQLRTSFETDEDSAPDKDAINSWNEQMRYTKAYVDDEDVISLEDDLDVSTKVASETISKFIKDYLATVPEFEKHLTE